MGGEAGSGGEVGSGQGRQEVWEAGNGISCAQVF